MKSLGIVLASAFVAGGLAVAQGPGGPGGSGMGLGFGQHRPPMERAFGADGERGQFWNNPRIAAQLKLTDEQRKAMNGIMQDHRMKLIDLRANLEKAEVEMGPLMKADQPNEAAILAAIDKVAQARAELEKGNARFLLAIRGQLTPDQWKQMQAMHENRGSFRGERGEERGRWGQGGPQPGMGGPGRFRQPQGPPPAGAAPQGAQAPPPPGGGEQE